MHYRCEEGVYHVELCPSSSQAHTIILASTRAFFDRWHHRLGHPSSKLLSSFLHSYNLLVFPFKSLLFCVSFYCNKYCWFFPMYNKSDMSSIFVYFTTMVEYQFSSKIKKIYSDNGGEFIKLKPIFAACGISHFIIAPHTPHQNSTVERRHWHIVKTSMPFYIIPQLLPLIGHMPWP